MKETVLQQELSALVALNGVSACALVDSNSGLVWHAVGSQPEGEPLWEAAIDYWRLHSRSNAHFAVLGELGAVLLYHRKGVLAIIPCTAKVELLVVCIASHKGVDWVAWQRNIRAMAERLKDF